jgi:hypothetical protein
MLKARIKEQTAGHMYFPSIPEPLRSASIFITPSKLQVLTTPDLKGKSQAHVRKHCHGTYTAA